MTVTAQSDNLACNQALDTVLQYIDAGCIHPNPNKLGSLLGKDVEFNYTKNNGNSYTIKGKRQVLKIFEDKLYNCTSSFDIQNLTIDNKGLSPSIVFNIKEVKDESYENTPTALYQVLDRSTLTVENCEISKIFMNITSEKINETKTQTVGTISFNTLLTGIAIQYVRSILSINSPLNLKPLLANDVKFMHISNGKENGETFGSERVSKLFNKLVSLPDHCTLNNVSFHTKNLTACIQYSFNATETVSERYSHKLSFTVHCETSFTLNEVEDDPKINDLIVNETITLHV